MFDKDQLSTDEYAAQMAERMLSKSDSIPLSRTGADGAEGGFTPLAGGKVIDADAQKSEQPAMDADGIAFGKSGKTGEAMTGEPGKQGPPAKAGKAITGEPAADSLDSGSGGNVDEDEDEKTRKRKAGQVGVSGGMNPGNLSTDGDSAMRGRKSGKVGIKKSEDEDEDEDELADSCKKSDDSVSADSLIKSLEALEEIAQGSAVPSDENRYASLMSKLGEGSLNKSEMHELSDLMKSYQDEGAAEDQELESNDADEADQEDLSKSFQNRWGEDSDLQEGYEVSSFLERHSQLTAAALDEVRNTLSKSLDGQREHTRSFNTQLAKSLKGMAEVTQRQEDLIKSLTDRLEHVENTPLPRKGASNVSSLQKSMPGEVGGDQNLDRNSIMNTLESMAMSNDVAPCGEPLMQAVAQFETTGHLSKSLYNDVLAHQQNGKNRGLGR